MEKLWPTIIVGHYGSGKTEFAVNLCEKLEQDGEHPVLADLDIVNPYFRSRELGPGFAEKGIRVISSNLNSEEDFHQDVPALAAAIRTCFESKEQVSIIDVGGDPVGATVLGQYAPLLKDHPYNMWITVNANRPQTATVEDARGYLEAIEQATRLKINGILNTTHMLLETTKEDILKGDRLVRELAEATSLEVVYTVARREVCRELEGMELAAPLFPISLKIWPDWL